MNSICKRAAEICGILLLWCSQPVFAIDHSRGASEPYALAGKRMVFTNWYYVRPGQPTWEGAKNAGPFEANLKFEDLAYGIRLVAEPGQRLDRPIVERTKPWEQMGLSIDTIVHDGKVFRAWARCQDAQGTSLNCYLESKDCETWERPNLGLVDYKGSRDNNLIAYFPAHVFIDPSAPPAERFKSVKHSHFAKEKVEEYKRTRPYSVMSTEGGYFGDCIAGAVSPDGVNWTELAEPLSIEPSDTQIVAAYDTVRKRYVMFTRSYMVGPRAEGVPLPAERSISMITRRAIGRTETTDFKRFPLSEVIIEPENDLAPTDTYYTNSFTTIPGAPDHYLMFPAIYHLPDDTTTIRVLSSYDSKLWHPIPGGEAVLKTNTFGTWDGGCVFAHPSLMELADGRWVLPYTGYAYPHKYPRGAWKYDSGLVVWPKGRLSAIEAQNKGEFTTIAFVSPGTKLRINAVTERAGSILIEAVDFKNNPIAGRTFADAVPIVGDQYRTPVTWKGASDLGVRAGEPVVLRFRMNKAKIYGLDFEQ